ncbi:hypothetical protein H0H81_010326 [Sphagnurus paluster]|uniref:Uncharacterized protein n=1 Tax=Sphagnurus paluster TaxID=117069 RepID=A0A9P7GI18_9AGAR|nr:hypothetical protein H0H81_010326 [Sphagnurus paluster]
MHHPAKAYICSLPEEILTMIMFDVLSLLADDGGRNLSLKSAATFHRVFPNVEDLTLEAHRPYTEKWVRAAFPEPNKLTRLMLRGYRELLDEDHASLLSIDTFA